MDGPVLGYDALQPAAYDAIETHARQGDKALQDAQRFWTELATASATYASTLERLSGSVPTSEGSTFRDAWEAVKGQMAAMSEAMNGLSQGIRSEVEPLAAYKATGDGKRRGLEARAGDVIRDFQTRETAVQDAEKKVRKLGAKLEGQERDVEVYETQLGGAAAGGGGDAGASGTPKPKKKGLKRMFSTKQTSQGLDKLKEKQEDLERELQAAERQLAAAQAELQAYEPIHSQRMSETFVEFEALERGRLDSLKAVMAGVGRVETEMASALRHVIDLKQEVVEAADPAVDLQRFISANVTATASWARISGNRPMISTDIMQKHVSSTATVALAAAKFRKAASTRALRPETRQCQDAACPVLTRSPDGFCPMHSPTAQAARSAAAAAVQSADAVMSNWTRQADPSSGREYYYNAATGETQWQAPEGFTTSVEDALPLGDTGNVPEGWTRATDPSTGQSYLYNAATGESKWLTGEVEVPECTNPMHR